MCFMELWISEKLSSDLCLDELNFVMPKIMVKIMGNQGNEGEKREKRDIPLSFCVAHF